MKFSYTSGPWLVFMQKYLNINSVLLNRYIWVFTSTYLFFFFFSRTFPIVLSCLTYWHKISLTLRYVKSLQSCPTLCDPIDGSPPGSPVLGILQARTLEWVAISSSNAWKWKVKVKSLSRVWLLATPWTAAHQASPSMGFSRQEYWSGLPLPWEQLTSWSLEFKVGEIPWTCMTLAPPSFHFKHTMVQKNFKIFQIKQIFPSILKEGGTIGSPRPSPSLSHSLAGDQALSGLMFRETGVGGTDSCLFPSRALLCFHSSE